MVTQLNIVHELISLGTEVFVICNAVLIQNKDMHIECNTIKNLHKTQQLHNL